MNFNQCNCRRPVTYIRNGEVNNGFFLGIMSPDGLAAYVEHDSGKIHRVNYANITFKDNEPQQPITNAVHEARVKQLSEILTLLTLEKLNRLNSQEQKLTRWQRVKQGWRRFIASVIISID